MPLTIDTDVPGIGQVLRTTLLRVPVHQRSFAWTTDEVAQLWEDVTRAQLDDPDGYFIGPIVLAESQDPSDHRSAVIDGQQRLATTSLLFAALAATFHSKGDQPRAELLEVYFGERDFTTLEREPRLCLGETDDVYFRALIEAATSGNDVPEPDPRRPSQGLLRSAYMLLLERISAVSDAAGQNWPASLIALRDFMDSSVEVIRVDVGTHQNAYLIFETLNDRGLQLTTSDLLKNHLLGQADNRLDEVRRAWIEMSSALAAVEPDDSVPQFLRHYWISSRGMVRDKALYKTISSEVRTPGAAIELANQLAQSAERYSSLTSPSHPSWRNTVVRRSLETLQLFRVVTPRPLLLAALEHLGSHEFHDVVEAVSRWSVRLAMVGGLGSGAVEEAYGQAARKVRAGELGSVSDLRAELSTVLPGDEAFEAAFATKALRNRRQARFLLASLERAARRDAGRTDELTANLDESRVNLEHIMPRNPTQGTWDHIREDDRLLYLERIGNFALMLVEENAAAGAGSFEDKKAAYVDSELILTAELGAAQQWSTEEISQRQQRMSALAVQCWPL